MKNNEGFWSESELEKHTLQSVKDSNPEICVCGHPKYMHYRLSILEVYAQCKVHGCRHDNNPCKKFLENEVGNHERNNK